MPKISKNEVTISVGGLHTRHEAQIMYNQAHKFYYVIKEEHQKPAEMADDAKRESWHVKRARLKGRSGNFTNIISADTEAKVLEGAQGFLRYATEATIVEEDVIIVIYNPEFKTNFHGLGYNDDHPQIGMKLGLLYAVKSFIGEKAFYYKVNSRGDRKEIRLWNEMTTELQDTPENREALEQLYAAFKNLNEKLSEMTKDSGVLQNFLESGMKLLK